VLHTAQTLFTAAEAAQQRLGGPARWILALSPVHAGGFMVLVRSLADGRGLVVALPKTGRFDLDYFDEVVRRETSHKRPVRVSLVPTQVRDLANAGKLSLLARCDAVLIGAAACPPDLLEQLAQAGVKYYTTYGMTETAGGVVWNGVPLPGVDVSVDAPTGEVGTISISGPTVALGYRGRPDLTVGQFSENPVDGVARFRTSDLGFITPSQTLGGIELTITGRVDDVVQVAGTSVSLRAVEAVLQLHELLDEAAVVGVEDERLGTRVVAVVVPTGQLNHAQLAKQLGDHVASSLGRPASPRDVVVVPHLPMLDSGKVDRQALAELAAASVTSD
jgi:O-succinylbenzoic acid--CoA ligase